MNESQMEGAQDFIADKAEAYILENLEDFVEKHEDAIRKILDKLRK